MTCFEIFSLVRDLIVSGAAIAGVIVATKGLNTWQRQLKGQSEYDLSRRILVSLFKYRDAINGVRHPLMWGNEAPSPPEEKAKEMSSEKIRFYGTSEAYQARWDKVRKERASLYTDLLEAEAIWDGELNSLFKIVFNLEHELIISIRNYLEVINPDTDEDTKKAIQGIRKSKRDVMYDDLSEEGDDFRKDFKAAVENIEKYLKPKLAH